MKNLYKMLLGFFMVAAMSLGSQKANAACKSTTGMDFSYSTKCKTVSFEGKNMQNGCLKYQFKIFSGSTLVTTANDRVWYYNFANNGTYTVRMSVSDTCNKCDTVIYKTITINCSNCNWSGMDYSFSNKCKTYTFEGKNMNNGCLKYTWFVFNGTNTVTLTSGRVTTYSFPANGSYTVKMKVTDTCKNCDTFVYKTITVNCTPCELTPQWSWKADCRKVKFYVTNSVSGATYYWYFGDNSTGSGADPSHTYVKDGVYKVCLYMTWKDANSGETCKKEVCKEIKISCGEPCNIKGDFQFYTSGNYAKFSASSNSGYYYEWDFGDGTTASGENVYHQYKKPGTYNVCVKIYNKTRKCSVKICKTVKIEEPCNLKAEFSFAKTSSGAFKFKAISNGGYYYEWNFGDGTSANTADPSHTFSKPGTYTVCVTIVSKDKRCKTRICKTVVVEAPRCNWKSLGADFSYNLICPKLTLEGKNLNNGCIKYSFGITPAGTNQTTTFNGRVQTITFNTNGTFYVCMKLTDTCKKCDTTICKAVTINCNKCNWKANNPYFSVWDSCKNISGYIGFNSGSNGCFKYTWMMNGTVISHDRYLKGYPITKNGTYELCCKVVDTCHNCDTTFCGTRTITCFSEKCIWKNKYPNFVSFTAGSKCLNIEAGLNTSSAGCIRQYYSLAGTSAGYDGKTYHSWTVSKPGVYVVCVKLVDTCNNCDTTLCKEVTVTSCCPSWAGTTFTAANNSGKCTYTFTASSSSNTCLKYKYTISGNSGSSVVRYGKVADYSFTTNGTYTVCMSVMDTCKNCDTTVCKTITVDCACAAKASFAIDSVTSAGVVYLHYNGSGAAYYVWDFGDSSYSTSSAPGKHAYKTSGAYTICLTVYDQNKTCSTTYCYTVKVSKTRGTASNNEVKINVPVNVYPNPASQGFVITTTGEATYLVYDLKGRIIAQGDMNSAAHVITEGWNNGVYIVRINSAEGTASTRVVIQK